MMLGLDEDDLVACVACGLCLPHCPTYRVTGLEAASPRGRIAAMQAVQLRGAPMGAAFGRVMEECVQCRGCEAACPAGVPFGRLMEGAREALSKQPGARPRARRVVEWIGYTLVLPRHWLLMALSWLLLVGQRARVVPRRFALPPLRARSLARPLRGETARDAILFPGCVMDAWQREIHRAALVVMRAAGSRPGLPGRGSDCCGALHLHAGRVEQARALARRVIAATPGDAPVVVDSAGCGAVMKDYARLVGTPDAARFATRVRDFSEWLVDRGAPALRATGRRVVVQDPCHLRHVQRAAAPVRQVLAGGYELVETDDDALCCGAGGAYNALQPELADAIRARKVEAIRCAAGAAPSEVVLVASANPGCAMHLGAVAGLEVRHPAELLAEALR